MIDISGLPNVDPATANLINGEMVDVTTPGDGTGTPVRKDWQSDLYYALIAIMNEAGIAADDTAEGATSSQVKDAILRVARRQVQGPSYSNLKVKRNAGTPNSKVDVTFDKLWIQGIEKTSGSYTLDITASGALGLDTGSESADAWYYIWVIAKADGTVSALLSASATAPTLPAGYIYKRLISMVRNTSGDFVNFFQHNDNYAYATDKTLHSTSSTTLDTGTERNTETYIPETVKKIYGFMQAYAYKSGAGYIILTYIKGYLNGEYPFLCTLYGNNQAIAGDASASSNFTLITQNRKIYTKSSDSTAAPTAFTWSVYMTGFEVPL